MFKWKNKFQDHIFIPILIPILIPRQSPALNKTWVAKHGFFANEKTLWRTIPEPETGTVVSCWGLPYLYPLPTGYQYLPLSISSSQQNIMRTFQHVVVQWFRIISTRTGQEGRSLRSEFFRYTRGLGNHYILTIRVLLRPNYLVVSRAIIARGWCCGREMEMRQ